MPYVIKKSDGTPLVTIPDGSIDNTTTSLTLIGKGADSFGLYIDQNFVNLLQNFAAASAPTNPLTGQTWYNTTTTSLNVYDGTIWRTVVPYFTGTTGTTTAVISIYNDTAQLTIAQNKVISVSVSKALPLSTLLGTIYVNDVPYDFASAFPQGLLAGINLATDPAGFQFVGTATSANVLTTARQISITGSMTGNVMFDGSGNVNLSVSFANVYTDHAGNVSIGNANAFANTANVTTIAGTYTAVTVNDGGQVIGGGNILNSDVINALGYTPWSGSNVNVAAQGNTVIQRDQFGNFNANVMTGTATYAQALSTPVTISISGDVIGSVEFDGSGNAVIQSNLVAQSSLTPGVYNTVTVDTKGRVTNAAVVDVPPVGSMLLYTQQAYVPTGWAVCNGQTVTTDAGTFTTPNLSNVSVGGAYYIMKVFNYLDLPSNSISGGNISVELIPGQLPHIDFSGGPNIAYPPLVYSPQFNVMGQTSSVSVPTVIPQPDVSSNVFYDAAALLLSNGDSNAIYMSQVDIFGDLSSMTVYEVLYNLKLRENSGLPPRCGKYMLSYSDIYDYSAALGIPVDQTYFTISLQDTMALIKVADLSNRFNFLGIYPSDSNLFGAMYLDFNKYMAILRGQPSTTVGDTLKANNLSTTNDTYTDSLTNANLIEQIASTISNAEAAVRLYIANSSLVDIVNSLIPGAELPAIALLLSQPSNTTGNSNVHGSFSTVDSRNIYYGGNISLSTPGYGGGSYNNTAPSVAGQFYQTINSARYGLNGSNGNASQEALSNYTGTGISDSQISGTGGVSSGGSTAGGGTNGPIAAIGGLSTTASNGQPVVSADNPGALGASVPGAAFDSGIPTALSVPVQTNAASGAINAVNGSQGYVNTEGGFDSINNNYQTNATLQAAGGLSTNLTVGSITRINDDGSSYSSGTVPAGAYGMGFFTGTAVLKQAQLAGIVTADQPLTPATQLAVQAWYNANYAYPTAAAAVGTANVTAGMVAIGWFGQAIQTAILNAYVSNPDTPVANCLTPLQASQNSNWVRNPDGSLKTVGQLVAQYNATYGSFTFNPNGTTTVTTNKLVSAFSNTSVQMPAGAADTSQNQQLSTLNSLLSNQKLYAAAATNPATSAAFLADIFGTGIPGTLVPNNIIPITTPSDNVVDNNNIGTPSIGSNIGPASLVPDITVSSPTGLAAANAAANPHNDDTTPATPADPTPSTPSTPTLMAGGPGDDSNNDSIA